MTEEGPAQPTLRALLGCFLRAGAVSLTRDPTAFLERELVSRRRWLSEPAFRGLRVLGRVAPGLPPVTLAIATGRRLGGAAGGVAAGLGMLAAPALAAAGIGLLSGGLLFGAVGGHVAAGTATPLRPLLTGVAAASAGLAFAAAVGGIRRIGITAGHVLVVLFMAATLALWHWPLVLVALAALPLSLGLELLRPKTPAVAAAPAEELAGERACEGEGGHA